VYILRSVFIDFDEYNTNSLHFLNAQINWNFKIDNVADHFDVIYYFSLLKRVRYVFRFLEITVYYFMCTYSAIFFNLGRSRTSCCSK